MTTRLTVYIEDMDCPVEQAQIEDLFKKDTTFSPEHFDFVTRRVRFRVNSEAGSAEALLAKLREAGLPGVLVEKNTPQTIPPGPSALLLTLAFVLAVLSETLEIVGSANPLWLTALSLGAIGLVGIRTLLKGLQGLLALTFNMNTLMAVAVLGAFALGEAPEAAMVMVLYEIGEAIEARTVSHAQESIRSLLGKAPQQVDVHDRSGWQRSSPEAIHAGTLYRVAPGEMLAADGIVTEGESTLDVSSITGEPLPQDVAVGSFVRSGSIALEGALTVRAQCAACESTAARIEHALTEAQGKKAQVERLIDRFARYYTPAIFAVSLAYLLIYTLLLGHFSSEVLYRALVLLVIGCPCALVISTPVAIVSALAAASLHGLFVRGGRALEVAATLKTVAFDKTGTLTQGRPALRSVNPLGETTKEQLLQLAASLANANQHPISRAIARAYSGKVFPVRAVRSLTGSGIEGRVEGAMMRLTNRTWLKEHGLMTPEVDEQFEKHEAAGLTALALSDCLGVLGVFALSDTVRKSAMQSIAALKREGVAVWLLTGDNEKAAAAIAREVGIENVRAKLLPQEKLAILDTLSSASPTAMVGDGLNDVPALARAHLGVAMGESGADLAIEAADVVLLTEDIAALGWLKRLSAKARRTIVQNIVFALGAKALFAVGAFAGVTTMWMAVFADTGVCLITVAWALRLLRSH